MEQKTYGVIITDYEHDVAAYHITDQAVWDWMHQQVQFPAGASSVRVPLPVGYESEEGETTASITFGSPDNDLLLYGVALYRAGTEDQVAEYLEDADSAAKAVKELIKRGVDPDDIAEGMDY